MSEEKSRPPEGQFTPPVSVFTGPVAELVGHRLLSPPTRPGLLASLARFEVLRVLGGGGMGVVVLARDSENGKDVAIKLIRPELLSDLRIMHRFVKEAGHLRKLKHPNVVPVLEVSDRKEGPYFVMPFFERGSLARRIRPGEPLEGDAVLEIAAQVAEGLAFAHRHGIIHRDLKPANILLGGNGVSCLADFGLARTMFNDSIVDVESDQLEGTAPYMSPGVAAGNAEDTRCDIYAFGALLYEMLTGEPPFAGRNTNDIRRQILDGPPKPICERNPEADAGLVAVAEGAMARELRDRYADMGDVLADLERIKTGKSPVGPHDVSKSASGRFSMWIPGGLILIGLGLWLLWSGTNDRTSNSIPATNSAPTNSHPAIPEAPKVQITPLAPVQSNAPTVTNTSSTENSVPAISPKWRVSLLAGQPGVGGSADGTELDARFQSPGGVAVDNSENLYVADTGNNTIRRISRSGSVTTLAGLAGKPGHTDGAGSEARFLAPMGIAVDASGNLYVTEFASDLIRKVSAEGVVMTLAGSAGNPGSENGAGDDAHFRNPWSVAVNPAGDAVFVVDKSNFTIREIISAGRVSTFAGRAGVAGFSNGPGGYARFGDMNGIAVAVPGQNVFVGDTGNYAIRSIDPTGLVKTFAGKPGNPGMADGAGDKARFADLQAMAAGELGSIYVIDNGLIRKISRQGEVATLPKSTLRQTDNHFIHPTSFAVGRTGNIYLLEDTNDALWQLIPPYGVDARMRRKILPSTQP